MGILCFLQFDFYRSVLQLMLHEFRASGLAAQFFRFLFSVMEA